MQIRKTPRICPVSVKYVFKELLTIISAIILYSKKGNII